MTTRSMLEIQRIQRALAHKGFDPGMIDGIWGRRTEDAVRRFQASCGLVIDGIVGPNTRLALFGAIGIVDPLADPALSWFQEARRLTGLREDETQGSNPKILDWAKDLDLAYQDDDVAWCGLFVAHCIASTLSREALPVNPLGARNWTRFGAPCSPSLGAILVFWRGARNGWQGHVGFYAGEEKGGIFHVLGGNQSNQVCVARINSERLLSARWPATAPMVESGPFILARTSNIFSENEG